jgi:FkbM family methyltransferase
VPRVRIDQLRVYLGLARRLAVLAPTLLSDLTNTYSILRVCVAEHGWLPLKTHVIVRVAFRGHRFRFAVSDRSEVEVLKEMFLERQYELEDIDAKVILDLGSNVGASIAFLRASHPDAQIIGFEPDPRTYNRLRCTVFPLQGVQVYQWAVAGRSGRVSFHPAQHSWESALAAADDDGTIEVDAITVPDLLSRLGIDRVDLLKVDVEGADWQMFDQPETFDACQAIIGELHLDAPDQTAERATRALADFDVKVDSRMDRRANFVAIRTSAVTS